MKKISLKNLIILLAITGLILSIPSIVYLFFYGNIDDYNGQNYYFIDADTLAHRVSGTIIFAAVIIFSYIFYVLILKKSNEFKNIKSILLTIFFVGLIFMICLPNTTTDIFYYMGTGRLLQEYGQNPYYVKILDFLNSGVQDSILERSGYWSNTVPPYGPLWTLICAFFSVFSFGNTTILLYIYKFASLGIHIATSYIVYKVTGRKKFAILYGLNPFLLIEFLTNVHNDLYLVFFVLLGIYFLKKKNNIWAALLCLTCSILIKYVTVIIAPFFALYYLRDKSKLKKLLWCMIYAIAVIAVILCAYMLFFDNLSDLFSILDTQQGRIKDSIYLVLMGLELNDWITPINAVCIVILAYCMILYITVAFFKKERFSNYMDDVKNLLYILIFGVLTNLASWYLSWLFIPIFWLKAKNIRTILCLQFLYEFFYVYLCYVHSDAVKFAIMVLPFIFVVMTIRQLVLIIIEKKEELGCKKTKKLS